MVQLKKTVFAMKFAANSSIDAIYDFMNVVVYERLAALCTRLLDNGNVAAAHLELSSAWVVKVGEGNLLAKIQVAARDLTPILEAASPEGLLNLRRVAYPDGELYPSPIVGQLEGASGVVFQVKGLPRGLKREAIPAFLALAYERPEDDFADIQCAKTTEEVRVQLQPGAAGIPDTQGYVIENPYFPVPRGALRAKLIRYPQRLLMPTMAPPRPMQRQFTQAAAPIPAPLPEAADLEVLALEQAAAARAARQNQSPPADSTAGRHPGAQPGGSNAWHNGAPRTRGSAGDEGYMGSRDRAGGEAAGAGGPGTSAGSAGRNAGAAGTSPGGTGAPTGGAGTSARGLGTRGAGAAQGGPGATAEGMGSRAAGTGAGGRDGNAGGAPANTRGMGLGGEGVVGRSGGLGPNARANNDAAIPRAATGGPAQGSAPPGGGPEAAETGNAGQPDIPAQGPQAGPEAGLAAPKGQQETTEADSLRRPRPAERSGESPMTQRPRHGLRPAQAASTDSWDEFERAAAIGPPPTGIRINPGPFAVLTRDDPGDADGAGDADRMQLGV